MKKDDIVKQIIPMDERPRCEIEGCNNPGDHTGQYTKDGYPKFRKKCKKHHDTNLSEKHGGASLKEIREKNLAEARAAGFNSYFEYQSHLFNERVSQSGCENPSEYRYMQSKKSMQAAAERFGYSTVIEYRNSRHPYLKYRKNYCQNSRGEAVWVDPDTGEHKPLHEHPRVLTCTATITDQSMLSVDHISGDKTNNNPENLQTLCHNCHSVKTNISKDNWSAEKKRKHIEKMSGMSTSSLVFG